MTLFHTQKVLKKREKYDFSAKKLSAEWRTFVHFFIVIFEFLHVTFCDRFVSFWGHHFRPLKSSILGHKNDLPKSGHEGLHGTGGNGIWPVLESCVSGP